MILDPRGKGEGIRLRGVFEKGISRMVNGRGYYCECSGSRCEEAIGGCCF